MLGAEHTLMVLCVAMVGNGVLMGPPLSGRLGVAEGGLMGAGLQGCLVGWCG